MAFEKSGRALLVARDSLFCCWCGGVLSIRLDKTAKRRLQSQPPLNIAGISLFCEIHFSNVLTAPCLKLAARNKRQRTQTPIRRSTMGLEG
ncbi:hypothetical protein CLOSTMETH_01586 [[Clostridium] methylpentosum DSM 5476]|uniref:Uncharacterized protein n=1 Tax=[Clostridium] methylpentosum DSM 5476 TaxID=537013 RepID=C0ECL5_9FIRM|nr:hypothetical protein CLOSTMETH_01586 [[Clostridium] methylpentosum DSM 5476]